MAYQKTDEELSRKASLLVDKGDPFGTTLGYLYAIAHSILPASEMFDFLLKHDIKGSLLSALITDYYRRDLNAFTQVLLKMMSDYAAIDVTPVTSLVIRQTLMNQSPLRKEKVPETEKKTNEQLIQEILDIV